MKINIFKDKKLEIDLPTFIDSRALICANSGGGKSYAVRKILEESSNKVMSIVLDVEGEFRTLREEFDFLLIGNEGDVELNMKSAKLLPKKIMGLEVSTIVDISDLKRNERIRYVKDFLEALMELPRKEGFWKPCLIVLDEAHLLAGQQEKQDSCSAVIDLMTRGRKRGYCGILCTQRISKLHKDAVAEANNIMIGRTGLDIDMKRASEILGFTNKKDMLSLRDLDAGEFFVFGTAISKHVTKAKVGEVKTTHPKVGMDLRKEIIKPTKKVISILSKLKDLPQEAEKKLIELNDYKKEILELKRQLRVLEHSKPKLEVDEKSLERARNQGVIESQRKYEKQLLVMESNCKQLENKLGKIGELLDKKIVFQKLEHNPPKRVPEIRPKRFNVPTPVSIPRVIPILDEESQLGVCPRKIYSLLFQYSERSFSKQQVGVFTGYSYGSGVFSNALSQLRNLGLIKGSGNNLQVQELNSEIAQNFDFSKEAIIPKLGKCEKEIYNVLLENPHQEFSKEELASATPTNYSFGSGGFSNALSRLNTFGIIERNNGIIKLNPELLEI